MTEMDMSNVNLDDLFISTQAAHQDVEKYDHKDKIEENKRKKKSKSLRAAENITRNSQRTKTNTKI